MASSNPSIHHVSDTATWVAYHRALEANRSDALFRDHMAVKLAGERGRKINEELKPLNDYVQFQVIFRTVIIDRYIEDLVKKGVDTILCLGAGLDARPYRLNLSSSVQWIEVDFENVIQHKNEVLREDKPLLGLERISLDLTIREKRQELFSKINSSSKNVLILTEGIIPYLTEAQVGELAADLHAQPNFRYWIAEYHTPLIYRMMKNSAHSEGMKNAKFQFMPADWDGFFIRSGWKRTDVSFLLEEALRTERKIPPAPWAKLFLRFAPRFLSRRYVQMFGMGIYEPNGVP